MQNGRFRSSESLDGSMWAANPLLVSGNTEVVTNRKILIERIPELLATIPARRYCPVMFVDCRACRRINISKTAIAPTARDEFEQWRCWLIRAPYDPALWTI